MANRERKDTRIHLVQELEQIRKQQTDSELLKAIDFIIREAKAGEYHDYKNDKYVCGKMASSYHLRGAGRTFGCPALTALAERIENGEFDEEADEEDKAMMRTELPQSMWPVLGLQKDGLQ